MTLIFFSISVNFLFCMFLWGAPCGQRPLDLSSLPPPYTASLGGIQVFRFSLVYICVADVLVQLFKYALISNDLNLLSKNNKRIHYVKVPEKRLDIGKCEIWCFKHYAFESKDL